MNGAAAASARRERRLEAVVSYSLLVLAALFALFPIAWMLSTSFKSEAEALSLPVRWIPEHPTLAAYVEMWTLKPFGTYFYNSIVVSGVTALLSTVVGALAGYGFSRFQFRGRTSLLAFFLATQMISGVLVIGPYFQILAAVELYNTPHRPHHRLRDDLPAVRRVDVQGLLRLHPHASWTRPAWWMAPRASRSSSGSSARSPCLAPSPRFSSPSCSPGRTSSGRCA